MALKVIGALPMGHIFACCVVNYLHIRVRFVPILRVWLCSPHYNIINYVAFHSICHSKVFKIQKYLINHLVVD